jgi:hypothetical protein
MSSRFLAAVNDAGEAFSASTTPDIAPQLTALSPAAPTKKVDKAKKPAENADGAEPARRVANQRLSESTDTKAKR